MNTRAGTVSTAWRCLFATGLSGLGVISLAYDDFALQWQPIPPSLPWHDGFALLSGGILVIGGIGVCVPLIADGAAWLLSWALVVFWVLPQMGAVASRPGSPGLWLGLFETAAVNAGAWMLVAGGGREERLQWARRVFGAACLVFGVSHFVYPGFTPQMIPSWLAQGTVLAHATGAAHMAAGTAILMKWMPRLAALLEALVMTSVIVLVHFPSFGMVPDPAWAPSDRMQLTALLWAMTLAGSAWILVGSSPTVGLPGRYADSSRH